MRNTLAPAVIEGTGTTVVDVVDVAVVVDEADEAAVVVATTIDPTAMIVADGIVLVLVLAVVASRDHLRTAGTGTIAVTDSRSPRSSNTRATGAANQWSATN